jgi:hypothetical protein
VLVFGSAAVGYLGFAFWRQLDATLATSSEIMGDLTGRMESLDSRLVQLQGHTTALGEAATSLSRSLARASVLLSAAQESWAAIAGWMRMAGWLRLLARL